MAEVNSLLQRGVCGNIRFKFYQITNAATTNSVFDTDMQAVHCAFSTQTTDKADSWRCRTLNWTGTCDTNETNSLVDTSETFVPALTGSFAYNTSAGDALRGQGAYVTYDGSDTDDLDLFKPSGVGFDAFPDGNETYSITDERKIMLTPATANDDGFVIVMGK